MPEPASPTAAAPAASAATRSRRRVLIALAVVLVLLALAITPPLINVSRLRLRIASSMTASLGRPVHLDRVHIHLLPLPGFTLENLVVSEEPRFGSEPIIRANVVEATLRTSSLWRRQVEFSTIRFIEPSLNLVRDPSGEWNIQSLLMSAARLQAAPTAQRRPGPAPRFPYIEATGARVNVKSGNEKKPYSLTDTDFALWLPSPQQWNVRLQGHPDRTDHNVSDAGIMRLEGSLQRSSTVSDVPVSLHASWHDAPLGEASALLTGSDAGWRGTLNVDADATGTLGHTAVAAVVHLNDLRRSDFLPARLLDIAVQCAGIVDAPGGVVEQMNCALPFGQSEPVRWTAHGLHLLQPSDSSFDLHLDRYPVSAVLDWARLFSQRIPPGLNPAGSVSGDLAWVGPNATSRAPTRSRTTTSPALPSGWSGGVTATLNPPDAEPAAPPAAEPATTGTVAAPAPLQLVFTVPEGADHKLSLQLQPVTVPLPGTTAGRITLTGRLFAHGYQITAVGTATPAQLEQLAARVPPLSDGLAPVLAPRTPTATPPAKAAAPVSLALTCQRDWPAAAVCSLATNTPPAPSRHTRSHSHATAR